MKQTGMHRIFRGRFTLDHPLTPAQRRYLLKFSQTRRMKWDVALLEDPVAPDEVADPLRLAVGPPLGPEGAYYVNDQSSYGLIDLNTPPTGQPGRHCLWAPSAAGTAIRWNGWDKFDDADLWIAYLITHFLAPWGYTVNGVVRYAAEDYRWSEQRQEDMVVVERGAIVVTNNVVEVKVTSVRPRRLRF
jgi:hypothetical protein